jgi:site-specific recombinase XerD
VSYLKVYEHERVINKLTADVVDMNTHEFNSNTMIISKPQCILFDKDWNRVEEVFEFLEQRKNTKRQEWNTIESKARALKLFYDFLEETKMKYYSITAREVNDFIAWLFKDDEKYSLGRLTERTAKTVNTYISHVRDFYKYHSIINRVNNPFEGEIELINRPSSMAKGFYEHTLSSGKVGKSSFTIKERGKKPITILGKNEIGSMLDASSLKRDRIMIALMLFTGMRIGEVLSLKVQAISTPDMTSQVQVLNMIPSKGDGKRKSLKTGTRTILVPPFLMKELDDYYTNTWIDLVDGNGLDHNYFFVSEGNRNKGKPLTYGAVESRFKKLFNEVGIDAMPHDFRHTYATNLARLGTDISTLAEMLGHKNVSTVGIYIKMAEMEDVGKILEEFYGKFEFDMEEVA